MKLADHFTRSGDVLFRWRGYLPLLMLPLFVIGLLDARIPQPVPAATRAWQVAAVLAALAGLAIRIVAVGTAPEGTSERSTVNPRASRLRTTGLYSLMRHPLYAGNTLTAVGLAAFTTRWYLPVIVLLLGLLYHERIAAREEAFLEERFGEEFRSWAATVPAWIPIGVRYRPSDVPFGWRRPLGSEFHGLMAIASVVFVLDLFRAALATGRLVFDPAWTVFFAVAAFIFVAFTVLKKTTGVFRVADHQPACPPLPPPRSPSR
jgi:protein-S-isoprenylcysteine O-methyltransferase Ste14